MAQGAKKLVNITQGQKWDTLSEQHGANTLELWAALKCTVVFFIGIGVNKFVVSTRLV